MSWKLYLKNNKDKFINDLSQFISIPSISAIDDHFDDVVRAGNWVANRLQLAGIKNARLISTETHPVVYGDNLEAGNTKPTILIYGHFDVQPVDPLKLWDKPPFDPYIKSGKIYGRGASDDKGNMLAPILAVEAILKSNSKLPVNIKFLFEGQEEIGSPTLMPFIRKNANLLKSDMIFSADGGQFGEKQPNLIRGLKGLLAFELIVTGAKTDQHSGKHGGGIANPAQALSQIISSMKDLRGKISIEGFYNDVLELNDDDRAAIAKIPFNDTEYAEALGVDEPFGETGYSTSERLAIRPTLEINGMHSGYQGKGIKTVLPSKAFAKISCRLVANQKPKEIYKLVEKHIHKHSPLGVTVEVRKLPSEANPFLVPRGHNSSEVVRKVLRELYNKEPFEVYVGGSIPILSMFLEEFGVHGAVMSFGLDDEKVHAPNEFFRLSSFSRAQSAYCMLIEEFGKNC